MLVERGSRYSVIWPVFGSSRVTRSVNIPPAQTSPRSSRRDIVRCAPRRRQLPFRDPLGLGIEQADRITAIFGKPQPVLGVDSAAPRPGVGGRRLEGRDRPGLGIDFGDLLSGEIQKIEVVLAVRRYAVWEDGTVGRRVLRGAERL